MFERKLFAGVASSFRQISELKKAIIETTLATLATSEPCSYTGTNYSLLHRRSHQLRSTHWSCICLTVSLLDGGA